MNEKYIEEKLKNHRMNKTLLWSALMVDIGGTVTVFLRAINTKNPVFEWIFVVIGLILIYILFRLIDEISSETSQLIQYFKKMEDSK